MFEALGVHRGLGREAGEGDGAGVPARPGESWKCHLFLRSYNYLIIFGCVLHFKKISSQKVRRGGSGARVNMSICVLDPHAQYDSSCLAGVNAKAVASQVASKPDDIAIMITTDGPRRTPVLLVRLPMRELTTRILLPTFVRRRRAVQIARSLGRDPVVRVVFVHVASSCCMRCACACACA